MPQNFKLETAHTLLVASTGGHLEQLYRLVSTGQVSPSSRHWVTFAHQQTDGLLADEEKTLVPYIASRGILEAARSLPKILKVVKTQKPDVIISTGAAIAVPTAFAALLTRTKMVYIESVSRFEGPSLTGRILQHAPWVSRYTQHPIWANKKWKTGPSVLSSFVTTKCPPKVVKRVFISLGTIKPYRFDRAVDALKFILDPAYEVRIQYGTTKRDFGDWIAHEQVTGDEFLSSIEWADLVFLHAGVGSALNVLDSGKAPVLLVRDSSNGEHVDNHQSQIARALESRGLARILDLDDPKLALALEVTGIQVRLENSEPQMSTEEPGSLE